MPPIDPVAVPYLNRGQLDFGGSVTFGLQLQAIATSNDDIQVVGYTKAGPFIFEAHLTDTDPPQTFTFPLPDIPVAVSVITDANVEDASKAYATVFLTANGDRIAMLCQGIITPIAGIAWPNYLPPTHEQFYGRFDEVLGANPAAGSEAGIVVPSNEIWEILAVHTTLVCDANAANRVVKIAFNAVSGNVAWGKSGTNITANQTVHIVFSPGGTSQSVTATSEQQIHIPPKIILPGDGTIDTVTENIQAGDDYSQLRVNILRRFISQ